MKVTMQKIKDAVEQSQELGDDELCFDVVNQLQHDSRLHDNFETALSALIENHGADALTSLAAVMRHYEINIELDHEPDISSVTIKQCSEELYYLERSGSIGLITENDIKPER